MRELMLGNKAVARGMYEAGCKVISSYPGTPSTEITEEAAKGTRSFGAYICNTDYESLKKERGQVLDCNVERIRELAPLVRCAMDENYFCVVGSSKEINKESELFDKIQPLIKVQG